MIGLMKMYCYRLFRQLGLYIIWAIIALMMFVDSMLVVEKTFSAIISETGSFTFLLSSILTAVFFSADNSSGFIKNYAGSVSDRSVIAAARAVTALIIGTLTICFTVICAFLLTFNIGDAQLATVYIGCLFLTTIGTSFIALLVSELFRKTVPTVIATIAISSGLVCELIGTITAMATDSKFILHEYCVTGMFKIYGNSLETAEAVRLVIVCAIYIVAAFSASIISIKKRDVV